MAVIDVEVARAWAEKRWPSPVVRRQVDFLLDHCPRAKEIPVIHCKECRHSRPLPEKLDKCGGQMLLCMQNPHNPLRSVWFDSTCDDAEERE